MARLAREAEKAEKEAVKLEADLAARDTEFKAGLLMRLGRKTYMQEELGSASHVINMQRAVVVYAEVVGLRRPAISCMNACPCAPPERLQARAACRNWAGRARASGGACLWGRCAAAPPQALGGAGDLKAPG